MCLHVHARHEPVAQPGDVTARPLPQELPRVDGPAGGDVDRTVRPPRRADEAEAA
jgi:hypothetical protein